MPNEELQKVKNLRLDSHKVRPAAQLTAVRIKGAIIERIQQFVALYWSRSNGTRQSHPWAVEKSRGS